MSKRIFSEHIEQIWNNKDANGIERFIAPNYRGFDGEEVISGLAGYKEHFVTLTPGSRICGSRSETCRRNTESWRGFPWRRPIQATLSVSRPRESECSSQASRSSGSVTASLSRSMRILTGSGC